MEYLNIKEVAAKFGVNGETVRRWIKTGQLKGIRTGKQWRIRRHDLSEFLKSNQPEVTK